jgi:flagellar motor switch protein FliN/FliY
MIMAEHQDDFDALDDIDNLDQFKQEQNVSSTGTLSREETKNLDLILDIPLTVTVELGRSKMLINDLLQLGQGSVIELTKLVGEPLEVLVNNKLVARGEVVVVNDKFGVRLTDIVSPMERVQSLT